MKALLLALLALVSAWPTHAAAHTRSQSQSRWSIDRDVVHTRVEADAVEVTRLYALGGTASLQQTFTAEAARAFQVSADNQACAARGQPRAFAPTPARIAVSLDFHCPVGALARGPIAIESALFLAVAPSHLHFVALSDAAGAQAEAVLTSSHPRAELSPRAGARQQGIGGTIVTFVPIGAMHVWTGLDHVAFILALVLLTAGNLRSVVFAASGFTLGHTATLALAATGVLKPDASAIEALIGFTIAFVALEAGERGDARIRAWSAPIAALAACGGALSLLHAAPMSPLIWFGLAAFVFAYPRGFPRGAAWLAMIFGLIHGCGFAGALNALELPRPRLIASLFGFNLGVELGQIVVIAAALLVGVVARRAPALVRVHGVPATGAALFALGIYWFASRLVAI